MTPAASESGQTMTSSKCCKGACWFEWRKYSRDKGIEDQLSYEQSGKTDCWKKDEDGREEQAGSPPFNEGLPLLKYTLGWANMIE
jgi:hypothetical protein